MDLEKNSIYYLVFGCANLAASFGGGMILGQGMNVLTISYLQNSPLLAFFLGTVWGLLLLQGIPKKYSQKMSKIFSFLGAFSSCILLYLFSTYAVEGKLINWMGFLFFVFLSIRFGFWFYSRVLRASYVAGKEQKIAWVELGGMIGVILGLIMWDGLHIHLSMKGALWLDVMLQLSAGLLDLVAFYFKPTEKNHQESKVMIRDQNHAVKKIWQWRLAITVMLLTIGVQVVIFSLIPFIAKELSIYLLATFYLGTASAALCLKYFNIRLSWKQTLEQPMGSAMLIGHVKNREQHLGLALYCIGMGMSLTFSLLGIAYGNWGVAATLQTKVLSLLFFVFLAAFFYEILALALIDRIGFEEAQDDKNMVIRTYSLMSLAAVISLWALSINGDLKEFLGTLFISLLLSLFLIRKRKLFDQN